MDDIDFIKASNGVGEAPRLTITAARSVSATTIQVDAVTNWPQKFVATAGTLNEETGLINPASVTVFRGELDGSNLTILEFAPGYVDNGNSVGQVVVLKPTTEWADAVARSLADVKDSLGGDSPVKIVVSDTEPSPDPDGKIIVWLEPL